MKFQEFAKLLQELENLSSRNEMVVVLAEFLQKLSEEEIQPVMYMMKGRIVPGFIPIEFNFSTKLLLKALEKGFDNSMDELNKELASLGDIGSVAEVVSTSAKTPKSGLKIQEVYERLMELANLEGTGSQEAKQQVFVELTKALDPISTKYVARIITGKMRLGMSDKTVLDALSWVLTGDKSKRELLDMAYGVRSDLGLIAKLVLAGKEKKLESLKVQPGIPVASKLVEREKSPEAVFERLGECLSQPKYDGLRTQIHFSKKGFDAVGSSKQKQNGNHMMDLGVQAQNNVRIFSRNMEPLTDMFPDIVEEMSKYDVDSAVLDAEAIGYDPKTGKFFPFQETIKRKRKYGVGKKAKQVPVKVFVFDILQINGKDVTTEHIQERIKILDKLVKENGSSIIVKSETDLIKSAKGLESGLKEALDDGLEGIIAKDVQSQYVPGTRNYDWIKLKANIYDDLVDSIDCVVLGYYYGEGARAKFGAGAFLVGVYNKKKDRFESIAKVGSGIKDDELKGYVEQVDALRVDELPKNVKIKKELMPDVLCRPEIVVVVDADEISKSKLHTAGAKKDGRGFSLRFPRLKEWGRVDKEAEGVTSVEEIAGMR